MAKQQNVFTVGRWVTNEKWVLCRPDAECLWHPRRPFGRSKPTRCRNRLFQVSVAGEQHFANIL